MSTRRMMGLAGVLLALGALAMALPGCGDTQETGPDGQVKVAPVVNPAPGVVPIEDEYKQQALAPKAK